MCAVNDVLCTAAYMNRQSMEEWWALRQRLGLTDAAFTAYWRPNCPVKTQMPEARASVYSWPGRAAIAIANRRTPRSLSKWT
jgi:hypothetical protein